MIARRMCSIAKILFPLALIIFLPISYVNADADPAQANVYDINPLRTPQPVVHTLVNLQDPLYLSGSYVKVIDSKYCNGCEHSYAVRDPNAGFIYNPGDPRLAEAVAYYHIDQYRNYIVNSVGVSLPALPITIDAHKVDVNGNDITGASYTPLPFGMWPGSIVVGDKNRIDSNGDWIPDTDILNTEMALNADVLIHEYAHAVTDRLRSGSYSLLPKFMQEGWADYLMCSRLNSPLVGDWTDRNGFRGYRRMLVGGVSQTDLWPTTNIRQADGISNADYNTARIYYNSMAWSAPLWELRERITRLVGGDYAVGSVLSDRLVLTAIPLFQVSGQSDANPTSAIAEGVRSLKQALSQLKPLYTDYQDVTDVDIDLAFAARFPKESDISQTVAVDERQNAWSHQTGRMDTVIAVIDSGLALNYYPNFSSPAPTARAFGSEDTNLNGVLDPGEDTNGNGVLDRGNLVNGWDFVSGNASFVDPNGGQPHSLFTLSHGTEVALNLAAAVNNGDSYVGMAWKTSLWVLRKSGAGVPWSAINQHGGEALRYTMDNKVDIVNFSAGIFSEVGTLDNPADTYHMPTFNVIQEGIRLNYGQGNDTLVVAAAGNNSWNIDTTPIFPASYPLPNIISVTTTGPLNFGRYNVDLADAAGATSFATPLVAGAIGLLLSEQKDRQEAHPGYRSLTIGEIKYLLLMSTDHVSALEGKTVSEGRLNVRRFLEYYESDADWDGYSDMIEALFGTDPNDPNSHPDLVGGDDDGDGLPNHLELAYGTIPIPVISGVNYSGKLYPIYLDANGAIKSGISAQDSDGDGIGDLAETRATNGYYTDPANPDTDGDGIPDGQDSSPSLFKVTVSNTLALKKPTTASDTFISFWSAANATDGNPGSWWQTTNSGGSHSLTVDLGAVARVHETRFLFDTQYSVASDYTLQFSLNGNFSDPATREVHVTGNSLRDRTDTFAAPIRARYVRLLITAPSAAGNFFRVKEFEVHGVMPANIAIAKTATASDDFYGLWKAPAAIDGNSASFWQTSASVSSPHWLQIDLGASSSVSSIVTHYDTQYNFASDYTLQFSNTGDFSATGSSAPYEVHVTNNTSRDPANTFYSPVKARYVRLLINQPTSGFFRVKEFEIIGTTP